MLVPNGTRVRVRPYWWELVAMDPGTRDDIFRVPVFSAEDIERTRGMMIRALVQMRRPFLIRMFGHPRDGLVIMHDGSIEVGYRTMGEWEGFGWE